MKPLTDKQNRMGMEGYQEQPHVNQEDIDAGRVLDAEKAQEMAREADPYYTQLSKEKAENGGEEHSKWHDLENGVLRAEAQAAARYDTAEKFANATPEEIRNEEGNLQAKLDSIKENGIYGKVNKLEQHKIIGAFEGLKRAEDKE